MRTRLPYLVALVVACAIVAAGAAFVWLTWADFRSQFKQAMRANAAREGQPLSPLRGRSSLPSSSLANSGWLSPAA